MERKWSGNRAGQEIYGEGGEETHSKSLAPSAPTLGFATWSRQKIHLKSLANLDLKIWIWIWIHFFCVSPTLYLKPVPMTVTRTQLGLM